MNWKSLIQSITDNSLASYLVFFGCLAGSFFFVRVVDFLILKVLRIDLKKDKTAARLNRKILWFFFVFALFLCGGFLSLHKDLKRVLDIVFALLLGILGVNAAFAVYDYAMGRYWERREAEADKIQSMRLLSKILKAITIGLVLFFLLDNLGVNISALVAGLGIGGIALALAAQTILGDLFSGFVIYLDRPFAIGDYITVDDCFGTIERIGMKTTRLRSISGEQLVIANSDLTKARIRNYQRLERRRISFKFGLAYSTEAKMLRKVPQLIRDIIAEQSNAEFQRCHFASFGEFSLVFEVVYFVLTRDYIVYMDTQQAVNLAMKENFERLGIVFAYPTQTLYLKGDARS